jgi:class 3 adenylate cyclase
MEKLEIQARKPDLIFYHKNAEISYDPTNKFYQATFPVEFEKQAYDFLESFINLVFADDKFKEFGALPKDRKMTDFYFDLLTEFGNLPWDKYNAWYFNKKARLQESVRQVIINAITQQGPLKIENFEFFAWLALVNFISVIIEEYFIKHFEKLNIMKETLRYFLGQAFETVLTEVFEDPSVDRLRAEKTPNDKGKIAPLINRYMLIFTDIADISHMERMLFNRDRSVFIDRDIWNKLMHAFELLAKASRRFIVHDKMRHILSDMGSVRLIIAGRQDRRLFVKMVRGDRELMQKLAAKAERRVITDMLREIVAETGSSRLLNVIRQDASIEDMFFDPKLRLSIMKILREIGNKRSEQAIRYMGAAADRVERSAHGFFRQLSPKEFERIVLASLENFSYYLRVVDNFNCVRGKYGKKSAYSDELSGLKIMRQTVIKPIVMEDTGRESMECVTIADDQKTRIENMYEEGNLFYIRGEGSMYPGVEGSVRAKKLFMFADLRNSTETTMKLTKDTAGYLTPYLNTVYTVSKDYSGTEIYFAGDGYAAHFNTVAECVRSAYMIHLEFVKLRREAEDKIKTREKELHKELLRIKAITPDMKISAKRGEPGEFMTAELVDFLKIIGRSPEISAENAVRALAEQYSMPKVEIGIGVTLGELFFAVIGEENVRFNIVLSPSLTQAARLSGSNPEVKQYLEKLYGLKNIPRKVYVSNKKLFNQGIVITNEVFNMLRTEVEMYMIGQEEIGLSYGVFYYYDKVLDRYISLSKLEQGITLKGMDEDVEVFEVFTPSTSADAFVADWIKKNKK